MTSTTGTTPIDWNIVADAWDDNAEVVEATKEPLTRRMLERLSVQPGDRVVELGAGTGTLALKLAELAGATGHVLATDAADAMVAVIRRRTAGTPGLSVAQADASATGLPAASFDAVAFRMGLMFTPDPTAAMTEIRRVLAPGGRLAVAVWAAPEHNPWLVHVGMAAMLNGVVSGVGPPSGPGEIFSLGDPESLRRAVAGGGFDDVVVEEVDIAFRVAGADEHVAWVGSMAPPIAAALRGASVEQRQALLETVADLDSRFATDEGLVLPGRALLASGRA